MNKNPLKPGWKIVKFGDIAQNIAIRIDPAEAETDIYVGLEHLDPETLHLRRWGHPSDVTGQKLVFKKGDVIFGRRRAYQRKLAIAEFDGICSAHAMVLRAKPEVILPEFLPFFLQSDMFMERAIEISVGSLSPTINWKTLRVQEFPLPPLEEQQRIAEILWAADEVVEKYKKLFRDFKIYMRQKIESFLDSTQGGEYSLTKVLTGSPESGCSASPSPNETGHYVLSLAALSADGYVPEKLKPVRLTQKMLGARLKKGDFLISRSNTTKLVGFAGIFSEDRDDVSYPDTMMRLPVDSEIIYPEYLEMVLLSSKGRKHMMKTASGTSSSMKKINRRTLSEFRFFVPDLKEQKRILEQISFLKDKRRVIADHLSVSSKILSRFLNEFVGDYNV